MIHAARIDERGVFVGMDELEDEAKLTKFHLPKISACDHEPFTCRWEADEKNPYGGAFVPLPKTQRARAGRPTLEQALGFHFLDVWTKDRAALPEVTLAWLDDAVRSVDFAPFKAAAAAYATARHLTTKD